MRVVITGVTKGLGRAMAFEFSKRGHLVYGCGRSAAEIRELTRVIGGGKRNFQVVDVASDEEVKRWARMVLEEGSGAPQLLLNNAAVINKNAKLWEVSAGEFSSVLDVNLKGVVNVIRHFAPAMISEGKGIIVNFSSGWGRSTDAEVAPYCASKWAIEGLTLSLAQELPKGLAAISLNPGIINTEMLQSCFGESASAYPSAQQWAKRAVPFLLGLTAADNGKQMTVE
jgi:NAD(P)-dependent dehydrogenase (short-subunit alcohol dehydrogenase family)